MENNLQEQAYYNTAQFAAKLTAAGMRITTKRVREHVAAGAIASVPCPLRPTNNLISHTELIRILNAGQKE